MLEVQTGLPLSRPFDYQITLRDEVKPMNVPPYIYVHFQKGEIERQVEEMLSQGLIHPNTSPFSSPVLLIRKNDVLWRFYTDYRALNEATMKDHFSISTIDEMLMSCMGQLYL